MHDHVEKSLLMLFKYSIYHFRNFNVVLRSKLKLILINITKMILSSRNGFKTLKSLHLLVG